MLGEGDGKTGSRFNGQSASEERRCLAAPSAPRLRGSSPHLLDTRQTDRHRRARVSLGLPPGVTPSCDLHSQYPAGGRRGTDGQTPDRTD
ncbi:hypothetical protein AAFF_G00099680 [Aldrovandia affinis]|uniref:Uncharacterized protein n=1 Tax=Aldrovandia affinis TaxID=143900 RepID=A0AAD7WBB7_9TELE|nr:hypothetical protein AAFF_G00099680 [Aldrovandia affinis]